jgi:hypothetical protein
MSRAYYNQSDCWRHVKLTASFMSSIVMIRVRARSELLALRNRVSHLRDFLSHNRTR